MRNSNREARARALAVVAANQTREQVERLFSMTDMLQSASDHADANAVLRATASELLPQFGSSLRLHIHWAVFCPSKNPQNLALRPLSGGAETNEPSARV